MTVISTGKCIYDLGIGNTIRFYVSKMNKRMRLSFIPLTLGDVTTDIAHLASLQQCSKQCSKIRVPTRSDLIARPCVHCMLNVLNEMKGNTGFVFCILLYTSDRKTVIQRINTRFPNSLTISIIQCLPSKLYIYIYKLTRDARRA